MKILLILLHIYINYDIINNVDVYTQEVSNFKTDNLQFRGNENTISYKGKYYNYDYTTNIFFVGKKLDNVINSGDTIYYQNKKYIAIDNRSNCNNYTDDYCVELLTDESFLHKHKKIILRKGQ